jgi:hypothetical protein
VTTFMNVLLREVVHLPDGGLEFMVPVTLIVKVIRFGK